MRLIILLPLFLITLFSCSEDNQEKSHQTHKEATLFTKMNKETTNITFKNTIIDNLDFNFLNYPNSLS